MILRGIRRAMQSTYWIDEDANVVRLRVRGQVTVNELVEVMQGLCRDHRFSLAMNAIADYREAFGEWDYSEVERFRDFVVKVPVTSFVRWAVVLKPGSLVAVGHVLILISEACEEHIRIRLFESMSGAQEWVDRDVGVALEVDRLNEEY